MDIFLTIMGYVAVLVIGLVVGIYLSRFIVKREFEKNPPISEEMIAQMLRSMGQPASKKRVAQITKQMRQTNTKKKKKK